MCMLRRDGKTTYPCRQSLSGHKLILLRVCEWITPITHPGVLIPARNLSHCSYIPLSYFWQTFRLCFSTFQMGPAARKRWRTHKPHLTSLFTHYPSSSFLMFCLSVDSWDCACPKFCKAPQNVKPNRDKKHAHTHTCYNIFHNIFIPIKHIAKPQVLQ